MPPLRLDLSLFEPQARVGKRYTLWYKVSLTNVSCYDLRIISARPFIESRPIGASDWELVITDPEGRTLDSLGHAHSSTMFGDTRTEYGDVIPFMDDPTAFERFQADSELQMDENSFVTLPPGKSIVTASSIFSPHTERLVDVPLPDGIGTAKAFIPAELKGVPPPPTGFRILDEYVFKKPGRYSIRAVFEHPGVDATPTYPYAKHVPEFLKKIGRAIGVIHESDFYPEYHNSGRYSVNAESAPIEFEVMP